MVVCLRYLPGGKQKFTPASFTLSMAILGLAVTALVYFVFKGVIM